MLGQIGRNSVVNKYLLISDNILSCAERVPSNTCVSCQLNTIWNSDSPNISPYHIAVEKVTSPSCGLDLFILL